MDNLPIWATVLIALLTTVGGGFGVWLINLYKAKKELKTAEEDANQNRKIALAEAEENLKKAGTVQAVLFYQDIIQKLKEDIVKFEVKLDKLIQDYLEEREEKAKLKSDNEHLIKENADLRKKLG